jgi:RNA polymerase sigma-70 factor, ECF subfamily
MKSLHPALRGEQTAPRAAMVSTASPEELLARATVEGGESLGQLLELYRNYLRLLASLEIGQRLQVKMDASDLVQETMLEAHKDFAGFRGNSEAEFVAWLRQVMASVLCGALRKYLGTKKRDIRLERTLQEDLDRSSLLLGRGFADPHSSPSQQAARREQSVILANALAKLPDDYREVLVLRHLNEMTFPEISRRMDRSLDSVEKLWVRGLSRLRKILAGS